MLKWVPEERMSAAELLEHNKVQREFPGTCVGNMAQLERCAGRWISILMWLMDCSVSIANSSQDAMKKHGDKIAMERRGSHP